MTYAEYTAHMLRAQSRLLGEMILACGDRPALQQALLNTARALNNLAELSLDLPVIGYQALPAAAAAEAMRITSEA